MEKKYRNLILTFFALILISNVSAVSIELLNTDPYPILSGDYANIRLAIYNRYDDENVDVKVTMEDSFPFKLTEEMKREKNYYIKGEHTDDYYQLLEYNVYIDPSAPNGYSNLELEIEEDGTKYVKQIPILISNTYSDFQIGNIVSYPEDVYTNTDDIKIELQITNTGDLKSKNVLIELIESDEIVSANSFSNRFSLGSMEASETKTATFYVKTMKEISPGDYNIKFNISYIEDVESVVQRDSKSKIIEIPLKVLGKPDFELEEITNADIKQDTEGELRYKINNIGGEKASRVSVDVIKDSEIELEFDKYSDYVGDLDIDENGEIFFEYSTTKDTAVKNNQIILSVRYVFNDEIYTQTFPVSINVLERDKSLLESSFFMFGMILLVVLISIFYVLFNRKQNKNK